MSATYTFKWPKGPEEVIITGSFDNWSKSLPMVKNSDGTFELSVPLPSNTEKILYKYVVDGEWKISPSERIEKDDSGIDNNILESTDLVTASTTGGSKIPEAGGLVTPVAKGASSGEAKATVLPVKELSQPSVSGEPGIVIPKNPETISAFSEVREVDPKTLNEPELTAAEKKKLKKKAKRTQYKAKKKKKTTENGDVSERGSSGGAGTTTANSSEQETTENEAASPEPTAEPSNENGNKTTDVSEGAAAAAVASASTIPLTEDAKDAAVSETPNEVSEEKPAEVAKEVKQEETTPEAQIVEEPVENFGTTLDPKSSKPEESKETPVADVATPNEVEEKEEEEEIIVAQGNGANVEEAITAQEGDVTLEEIKPSKSEIEKFKADGKIPSDATDTSKQVSEKSESAKEKEEPKKEKEEPKKKKKSGLSKFFKKLFK